MRSYICQLCRLPRDRTKVDKSLHDLYGSARRQQRSINFDECREELLRFANSRPRTVLILDALDECDKEARRQILNAMSYLVSEATRPVKIFISSRVEVDIKTQLEGHNLISIEATDNKEDIKKFILEQINKQTPYWTSISDEDKEDIKAILSTKGAGM